MIIVGKNRYVKENIDRIAKIIDDENSNKVEGLYVINKDGLRVDLPPGKIIGCFCEGKKSKSNN